MAPNTEQLNTVTHSRVNEKSLEYFAKTTINGKLKRFY